MSKIDKNVLNVIELLPPFEDSQEYCQWDAPVVPFALALGDRWPLAHLLGLLFLLARRLVVGSFHELESNLLLLTV